MRSGTVALFVALLSILLLSNGALAAHINSAVFSLHAQAKFLPCFRGSATIAPAATVIVNQGVQNDTLVLYLTHFRPGLGLDLFTIQSTNLNPNGTLNTGFKNPPGFGLAWYQSDVEVDPNGQAFVSVVSKFVDEIFGFDPGVALPPTNAFHVGIWFDNPKDAVSCGFDATKPTPFNGTHNAGPNAMITVPNGFNLGPLCLNPIGLNKCTP